MASSKTIDLGLLSFFIFCCCSIISPYVQANDEATNIDNLKKYRCVFLHGIGYLGSGPANSSDVEGYWGGDDIVRENTPRSRIVHVDVNRYKSTKERERSLTRGPHVHATTITRQKGSARNTHSTSKRECRTRRRSRRPRTSRAG